MLAHFHLYNLFFQKGRKDRLYHTGILHQIFENGVVDGVCYTYYHRLPLHIYIVQRY